MFLKSISKHFKSLSVLQSISFLAENAGSFNPMFIGLKEDNELCLLDKTLTKTRGIEYRIKESRGESNKESEENLGKITRIAFTSNGKVICMAGNCLYYISGELKGMEDIYLESILDKDMGKTELYNNMCKCKEDLMVTTSIATSKGKGYEREVNAIIKLWDFASPNPKLLHRIVLKVDDYMTKKFIDSVSIPCLYHKYSDRLMFIIGNRLNTYTISMEEEGNYALRYERGHDYKNRFTSPLEYGGYFQIGELEGGDIALGLEGYVDKEMQIAKCTGVIKQEFLSTQNISLRGNQGIEGDLGETSSELPKQQPPNTLNSALASLLVCLLPVDPNIILGVQFPNKLTIYSRGLQNTWGRETMRVREEGGEQEPLICVESLTQGVVLVSMVGGEIMILDLYKGAVVKRFKGNPLLFEIIKLPHLTQEDITQIITI